MTTAEIMANINYNESLIDRYESEIRELNSRISVLSEIHGKYSALQTDFDARIGSRKNKLNTTGVVENKIFSKFYEGMSNLLSGKEYEAARNSPSEAKGKIDSKVSEYEESIAKKQGDISYLKGRNEYWRSQLQYAEDAQ